MASGHRNVMLAALGIVAVLLILSFTAYRVTTFDSVRGIVGDLAAGSTMKASLHSQYLDMKSYFNENRGDTFVYWFGGMPVAVDKASIDINSEERCTGLVLDIYTAAIYHANGASGIPGAINDYAGAGGNSLYVLAALITFIFFAGLLAAIIPGDASLPSSLKSCGALLAIVAGVLLILSLLVPGVLMSLTWDDMPGVDGGRSVIYVVISDIAGKLLVSSGIILLLGALMFGAGYYLDRQGAPADEKSPAVSSPPPQKPGRRAL